MPRYPAARVVPSIFKHLAGRRRPTRPALVVHGVLANADLMRPFARALVKHAGFDGVYGLDSWSYYGAANRGWQLKTVDLLDIVQPAIRGMVLGLPRPAARRAAVFLQAGNYVVEGAAQEVASVLQLLPWKHACLIGHCLGGLVVRCAVEAHDLGRRVGSVVTLGSAHSLWLQHRPPEEWAGAPRHHTKYLAIVGDRDWVCRDLSLGDLCDGDEEYPGIVKVIYPEENHWGVHRFAARTWIPELISTMHFHKGLPGRRDLYVVDAKPSPRVHVAECSGPPPRRAKSVARHAGRWLEFTDEEPYR